MYVSYVGLAVNLFVLFGGILKNPGIPQPIIDKILKDQLGKGEDDESQSSEDDEEKSKSEQSISTPQPYHWCRICQIETQKDTYHCEDCLVCIDGYDHHCVFFSKCIGGGNINMFWGSMAGLVVNFLIIVAILVYTGFGERPTLFGKE